MKLKISTADQPLIAKTPFGLETVLARELKQLGARDIKPLKRAVQFTGDLGFIYKANLWASTALRILRPIASFDIRSQDDYYRNLKSIPWEDLFDLKKTIMVDTVIYSDHFSNSHFASLRAKDAVVDRFSEKFRRRPSVDKDYPEVVISIHLIKDKCEVFLDSSGRSLHRRGYRVAVGPAPINEVLAAGLLRLSGWEGHSTLYDPMCGSGTMLTEAAIFADNIPANIYRKDFSFMHWHDYDADLHATIEESALNKARPSNVKILGSDQDMSMLTKAKINIEKALFQDRIVVWDQNFIGSTKPEENGLLIFNPPYDQKLVSDNIRLYKQIGDTLKQGYDGWSAWFITSDLEALKHLGLRTKAKIKMYNGKLECRLVGLDLYSGK
ncbi:THUMP domain-containing class I SAM-dependent RNA methyltransferase [Phaeocystidibacter luteus]|uniref:Class I SAM-dependent RNA methyltransferase n=1 Tax=Phaeocystidibacter luteus TaxID=911197 RepID=A0A6N6RM57_9FLAO|nr:class I SAM-dependent RNA methyltransferase [Phaeocystidibacter luteus]KAB2814704.1 class I SAM-dependent RNA methyltransferase [Phaeocystidibacter luteus]